MRVASTIAIPIFIGVLGACAWLEEGASTMHRQAAAAAADQYKSRYEQACSRIPQLSWTAKVAGKRAGNRGALSIDEIRRAITSHIGDVRECYEAALAAWPDIGGRLSMKFVIGPDGHVTKVGIVTNETGILHVGCCVGEAIERWTFPAPAGGDIVVVTYPFVLEKVD